MDAIASWLVHQPLHILYIALILAILSLLLRRFSQNAQAAHALLVAAIGWLAYAGWEWWVTAKTPEANIRIDLLLIWPVVALLTLWAIFRLMRPSKRLRKQE